MTGYVAGRAYVISLPERAERRARVTDYWRYRYPSVPLTVVDAATAGTPTAGCLASHLRVLAAARGPALVLEDDAVFAPGFTLELAAPPDWQVLWLGRQKLAPERPVDAVWARPWRIARTHAYVARDPQLLHRLLAEAGPASIDPALSRLPLPQYMLRTATVGQGAGRSDITGAVRATDEFWNQ